MAAILNTAILNLAIFDSSILVCHLKLTHPCQDWFPPICTKKLHSFILTQLDDGSHLEFYHVGFRHCHLELRHRELSSLRFTQKHSHSTLTLTQTNSIWLKVIHSHFTWWWQPSCILSSWILTSWILPFCSKLWLQLIQSDSKSFILTSLDDGSHLEFYHLGFSHLSFSSQTHSHLPRLVPTISTKKLHSFILTQLDDGSHLEFCHLGFSHFAQNSDSN